MAGFQLESSVYSKGNCLAVQIKIARE